MVTAAAVAMEADDANAGKRLFVVSPNYRMKLKNGCGFRVAPVFFA